MINKRILKISIALAIILITGSIFFNNIKDLWEDEIQEKPVGFSDNYDITPPEIKNSANGYTQSSGLHNNIQAPHIEDLEIIIKDGNLIIKNISYCGTLTGSSMQPTIFTNNIVCYRKYIGQELKEGQIIRFEDNGDFLIHRIKGIYGNYVLTHGDNNLYSEIVNYTKITDVAIGVIYK